jgi:hypothetical protein
MPDRQVSSGCYVYGIVAAADIPSQECHGVGDARVDYVRSGPLAAAVSAYDQDREVSLRADLTAHTRVLDWLADRTTVIPMAFGTVTDATAVEESVIEPGAEMLLDLLEWLRGTSQFNLRGIYHRERVLSDVVLADPGLTRLHERTRDLPQGQPDPALIRLGEGVSAALDRQKAEDSERILGAVAPFVVDLRDRVSGDMDQVFDLALLVPQAQRAHVEATLEEIAEAEQERMRLQLTGPFPPYDFVKDLPWVS